MLTKTFRPLRSGPQLDGAISATLLIAACTMLAFYLTVGYPSQMHSDSAMKLLLGEEMARQFTLLPRDWYYVNDIWLLSPNLIATPLSFLFEPSMALHGVVDLVAASLVLWAAYVASRAIGINGGLRLFAATMLATGLSLAFAEMVFAQSAYSAVMLTLLLLAGSGARYLSSRPQDQVNARTRRRDLGIIGGLVLISVASGPRGIATYVAPLLFASVGLYLLAGRNDALRAGAVRLGACTLGAAAVGGIGFLLLLHIVRYLSGAATQAFAGPAEAALHLRLAVMNWFMIFDALPPAGQKFSVVTAGIHAARLGLASVLLLLPIALALRVMHLRSPALRFLVLFQLGLILSTGYMLGFTNLLVDEVVGVPRYVMPLVPIAILIAALWLQEVREHARPTATHVGWLVIAVALSLSPQQLIGTAFARWPQLSAGLRTNQRSPLVDALRQAGLHRGYAGYWDANVLSILSGGDIRVAPILIGASGLPEPHRYLGSERWYSASWADEPSFLITDPPMRDQLSMPALVALLGPPTRNLHVGEYEILVFATNMSERLSFAVAAPVVRPRVSPQACAADLTITPPLQPVRVRQAGVVTVHARNDSTLRWMRNYAPGFNPGLRIINANGTTVADLRGILPTAVEPGESVTIPIPFRAPDTPGQYRLQFSFVAEGEAWCGDLDAGWAQADLVVEP